LSQDYHNVTRLSYDSFGPSTRNSLSVDSIYIAFCTYLSKVQCFSVKAGHFSCSGIPCIITAKLRFSNLYTECEATHNWKDSDDVKQSFIRAKLAYDVHVVAHSEEVVRTHALFDERASHKACSIQAIAYGAVA
jgi:hypothetical protein